MSAFIHALGIENAGIDKNATQATAERKEIQWHGQQSVIR